MLDNQKLQINFRNPINNKPTTHTYNFSVTQYDDFDRLEVSLKNNVFTYIRSDRLICNENLYGIWNLKSTHWAIYTNKGTYVYYNEAKNRISLLGYYSLWRDSKGEEWISKAQFVPKFGNFGFAISKIKIDGDTLLFRTYYPSMRNKPIQTKGVHLNKVSFEDVKGKPWWEELQSRKFGFSTRCKK